MNKIILDKKGYEKYLKSIEDIREKIRENSSLITLYQSDDAYGDGWHDNFAYEQAIQKENSLFFELHRKLEGLDNIEIINEVTNKSSIQIGDIFEVKFDDSTDIEKFILSGSSDSEYIDGILSISVNSIFGKNIVNKNINDSFKYEVDKNIVSGIIINIVKAISV